MKKNLLKMMTILGLLAFSFSAFGQVDCDCSWEFEPVCVATDDGDVLTFPNACIAECEGFGEDSYVECDDDWPGDDCDCEINPDEAPVCVLTTGDIICVFPNLCFAECAGYAEDDLVDCENDWPGDCVCSDEFDPVCVEIEEGVVIPFPNACLAECEGFGEDSYVDCDIWPGDDCDCEINPDEAPVCVLTAEDIICPFPNMCFAECMGYTEEDVVDCGDIDPPVDCECTDEFDPVCVTTDDGIILFFPNACFAECEGFGEDSYMDCDDDWPGDCVCTEEFDPVCVELDNGDVISFPNACHAECEGFGEDEYFECDIDDPCGCDDEGDVVCVEVEEGFVIPFPNECWALCAGFGEDSFVDCLLGGSDDEVVETHEELYQILIENGFNGKNPSGNNFDWSKINQISKATVYPNPVNDLLQIQLNALVATDAQLNVLSITGKRVASKTYRLEAGSNTLQLNASEWHSGIYFAKIQTGERTLVLKFVK